MSRTLCFRNRQRARPFNAKLFRQIALALLSDCLGLAEFELGVHLVAAPEMAAVNETYLQHAGSTDVITFSYLEPSSRERIHGELFICIDDAILQALVFRTTWQGEVVRYLVHGVLHLLGHDDLKPAARRKMKREENRLVRELSGRFALSRLAERPKVRA